MLKNNLYHLHRFLSQGLIVIMPYLWVGPSFAQAPVETNDPQKLTNEVFQYLVSQFSLQGGDISLSYDAMFDLAKKTRDPRIAQQAMEIALAAQSASASLDAARLWDELAPKDNHSSKEVLITLLMLNNRWEEVVDPMIGYLKTIAPEKRDDFLNRSVPILAKSNNQEQSNIAMAKIFDAIQVLPNQASLQFIYAMGEERLGRYDQMEMLLRFVLKQKPNDAGALNALGYSLADRNMKLPEALELIQQALLEAPNDPFILDSLGWVYYRLGNISEAIRYLTQSFEKAPEPEVGAHLGEVLWVNGQESGAKEIWQKAETVDPHQTTLRKTIQRFVPNWNNQLLFDESINRKWAGRFSVNVNKINANNTGGSGTFSLVHENMTDLLEIQNPLGASIAKINITPKLATIERKGETVTALDADQLIFDTVGLPIPARGLSAWLSGFVRPGSLGSIEKDAGGLVKSISQDGWQISYVWSDPQFLKKLFLTRSGEEGTIEVRLIFDKINE